MHRCRAATVEGVGALAVAAVSAGQTLLVSPLLVLRAGVVDNAVAVAVEARGRRGVSNVGALGGAGLRCLVEGERTRMH